MTKEQELSFLKTCLVLFIVIAIVAGMVGYAVQAIQIHHAEADLSHNQWLEAVRNEGSDAQRHGIPSTANPHIGQRDGGAGGCAWLEGYMREQDKK